MRISKKQMLTAALMALAPVGCGGTDPAPNENSPDDLAGELPGSGGKSGDDGQGGDGGADSEDCYSPTNAEDAYEPDAQGCKCDGLSGSAICVGRAALICDDGVWEAVEDGPCAASAECVANVESTAACLQQFKSCAEQPDETFCGWDPI